MPLAQQVDRQRFLGILGVIQCCLQRSAVLLLDQLRAGSIGTSHVRSKPCILPVQLRRIELSKCREVNFGRRDVGGIRLRSRPNAIGLVGGRVCATAAAAAAALRGQQGEHGTMPGEHFVHLLLVRRKLIQKGSSGGGIDDGASWTPNNRTSASSNGKSC